MSNQQSLSISAPGLNDTDLKVLQVAVVMLGDEDIQCSILEGINGEGEIVVLDIDTDLGKAMYQDLREYQVKILLSQNSKITEKNTISLRRPFRVTTLKDVLQQICNQIYAYIATHQSVEMQANNHDTNRMATEQCVESAFLHMYRAKKENLCLKLSLPGQPDVYIHGIEKTIYARGDNATFEVYFETGPSELSWQTMDAAEIKNCVRDLTPHALDAELWQAAIISSNGKLMPGQRADVPVKLNTWPNFSRQGFRPDFFKIAAFLAKRAVSLNELSKLTEIQLDTIVDFYNAAFSVGLIEQSADTETVKNPQRVLNKDRKSLLGKLAERLRFA